MALGNTLVPLWLPGVTVSWIPPWKLIGKPDSRKSIASWSWKPLAKSCTFMAVLTGTLHPLKFGKPDDFTGHATECYTAYWDNISWGSWAWGQTSWPEDLGWGYLHLLALQPLDGIHSPATCFPHHPHRHRRGPLLSHEPKLTFPQPQPQLQPHPSWRYSPWHIQSCCAPPQGLLTLSHSHLHPPLSDPPRQYRTSAPESNTQPSGRIH